MTERASEARLSQPGYVILARVAALCRRVSREQLWLLTIAVGALVAADLPILYALATAPPGTTFQGFVHNPPDGFTYLAWMRQGYEGAWLVADRYTAEATAPALVAPFYVLLGKLTPIVGGDLRVAFHVGRLLTSLAWLAAVAAFCRHFLPRPSQRVLAFALVCLAGGLGWLARGLGIQSIDIYNNDATGFLTLSGPPHLPLSQALILGAVLSFLASLRSRRAWLVPVPGLLLALGGLVHPYGAPLGLAVLALLVVLRAARERRQAVPAAIRWCLTLLLAISPLIYYQWLGRTDPVWSQVMLSNANNLAPIQMRALLIGYGPVLALAAVALPRLVQRRRRDDLVLPLWVALAFAVAMSPIDFGARFLGGIFPPLVVLAVLGLTQLRARWRAMARRGPGPAGTGIRAPDWGYRAFLLFLLAITVPSTVLVEARSVLGRGIWTLETGQGAPFREPPVYLQRAQLDAIRWLSLRPEHSVVLASPTIGNVLPALSGNSVVIGHLDLTPTYYEKLSDVQAFFSADTKDGARQQLLRHYDVEYVYYGANERRYGSFDPSAAPQYLREVFAAGDVAIYQVDLPATADASGAPMGASRQRLGGFSSVRTGGLPKRPAQLTRPLRHGTMEGVNVWTPGGGPPGPVCTDSSRTGSANPDVMAGETRVRPRRNA